MWAICKKEFRQFFNTLTGYLTIGLFLLLNGLFLFVFSNFNVFEYGYATLENFFIVAPNILLLLIPAITMRLFPDEWRNGTMEILQTKPLTHLQITVGKYLATLLVVLMALLPTLVYVISIQSLTAEGSSLDFAGLAGSYLGLFFLSAAFSAISLCLSSYTSNSIVAFLLGAFICFAWYAGFDALANLPALQTGADYFLQLLGMKEHYHSLSRGVIDLRDVVYFISLVVFFLFVTVKRISNKA